jgi:hypothetical protein
MKRTSLVIASALAAGLPVAAAAAGDPLAQAKADLTKLTADATAAASTVASDAMAGSLAQLRRDSRAGHLTLRADWKLLLVDATAARKAGGDRQELKSLLKAARTQLNGFRSAVWTAFAQAKHAAKQSTGPNGPAGSRHNGKPAGRGSDKEGSGG